MNGRIRGNAAQAVKPLLVAIDQEVSEVKELERALSALVSADEDAALLQTILGVGLITASTVRAYTDDINRYESSKKYAAHAGLSPWVQNSNKTIRHGHTTKRGPVELRTAFVRMVMGMLQLQNKTDGYRLMYRYRAMKKSRGTGKSIIATARKMSAIVYAILRRKQPFDPSKMTPDPRYLEMSAVARHYVLAA